MRNRYANLYRYFFVGMDLFALNCLHLVLVTIMDRVSGNGDQYLIFFLVSNLSWLTASYVNALYSSDAHLNFERFTKRSVKTFVSFSVFMLLFIFLSKFDYSRMFVILNILGFGLVILLTRVSFLVLLYFIRRRNTFGKRVIILGYNELSKKLVSYLVENSQNISVEGYFEDPVEVKELSYFPILGSRKECLNYAMDNQISEIYSTLSSDHNQYVFDMARKAESNMIRMRLVPDFQTFANRNVHVDFIEDIPVLSLRAEPLEDITARIKKRIFDMVFSFLVIVLIFPWLLPIIAILIKLESRGPVFFTQSRSGRNNRTFKCFKFRTLRQNKDSGLKQVTMDDARMTRIGSFLRKTNLDEIPQFINVFLGDMSVVGPRPHPIGFFEYQFSRYTTEFSRELNEYMIRHFIKPGVTGWAQVKGYRGEIRDEEQLRKRIEFDIWYLENWSPWLDLRIIFLTIMTTIVGDKNAY